MSSLCPRLRLQSSSRHTLLRTTSRGRPSGLYSAAGSSTRGYATKKSRAQKRKERERAKQQKDNVEGSHAGKLDLTKPPWELVVTSERKSNISKDPPSHIVQPIAYIRRIEEFLEPVKGDVLTDLAPLSEQRPIARLAHGLERVLFNHGVYWLQEPRSQVYNFTPWLQNIPHVKDFAFERIRGFVKSSRDQDLWHLCEREDRDFGGSTSSMTGLLSHMYFLLSGDRPTDMSALSRAFRHAPDNFNPGSRWPTHVQLNFKDGRYAIDSLEMFPGQSETNILTWQGHLLEKFLTTSPTEFRRYMRSVTPESREDPDPRREPYRYSKSRRMVMRSQLDCVDSRLPGTGIFDLKTRAAVSIRMDHYNYEESSGYMIHNVLGQKESFEKEYYDLIRSAFLKYSFQARIGNMDGVLVAYHNTARIFGFQYIPLEEMEERLYGGKGRGARVFEKLVSLLEMVLPETTRCFPGQSVKLLVEAQEGKNVMNIWVQPADWNEEADGPAPTTQLDITATNFIDGVEVPAPNAIAAASSPVDWTVCYSISHMALRQDQVRSNINAAKKRMLNTYSLPTGLGLEDMAKYWSSIGFGGVAAGKETMPFDPSRFTRADGFVMDLRARSRAGREWLTKMEESAQGKPKVVVGEYEEYEPLPKYVSPVVEVEEAAKEVEGAATPGAVSEGSDAESSSLAPDEVSKAATVSGAEPSSPIPDQFHDSTSVKKLYQDDVAAQADLDIPVLEQSAAGDHAEPHVVNQVPDFEVATGEVNPESAPIIRTELLSADSISEPKHEETGDSAAR
ncbi:Pet127-domain-containing protein [Heliocybe sulcata]|uniref:Pet127-domain-containing protein n=1 Tax=Heliocybe sulcata TaxID=5364 RepID=A0A5C3N8Y3_9AGAM|nr:Pet127-domain-containing protein [Heliocybe sulcata]